MSEYIDQTELHRVMGDIEKSRILQRKLREADIRQQQRLTENIASLRGHLPDNDPIFNQTPSAPPQAGVEGGGAADGQMTRPEAYRRLRAGGSRDGVPAEFVEDFDDTVKTLGDPSRW